MTFENYGIKLLYLQKHFYMKKVTFLYRQNSSWAFVSEHTFNNRFYQVDEHGNFYRNKKLIKNKPDAAGSITVLLFDDENKPLRFKIHQIVGQTYLKDQLKDFHTIDHVNRNRLDNRLLNLRVADRRVQFANRENKAHKYKKVICLNNNTTYISCQHAEIKLGIAKNMVSRVARGGRKHVNGFKFEYSK